MMTPTQRHHAARAIMGLSFLRDQWDFVRVTTAPLERTITISTQRPVAGRASMAFISHMLAP